MEEVLKLFNLIPEDVIGIVAGAAFFVFIWITLDRFLFRPYLRLFEARERATSGAESTAFQQIEQAEQLNREYEEKVLAARIKAVQKKLERAGKATQQATSIVSEAENAAMNELLKAREEMNQSLAELKAQVFSTANQMADDLVQSLTEPPQPASKEFH